MKSLIAALALAGCGEQPVHIPLGAECEMLDPEECLLPWPSSRFLEDAGTETETGLRVAIDADAMPRSGRDVPVDPEPWNDWDGFSAMTSMMARFEGPIDDVRSELPTWRHPEAGELTTSPTLLFEVTDDGLVPVAHFAETEPQARVEGGCGTVATETGGRTTLYVRPAARLREDATYIVAVRDLVGPDGASVEADAPFAALREGTPTDSPAFEARRAAFEADVLVPLVEAGVDRSELTLAWTFHTASGRSAWGDLRHMRDVAVDEIADWVDPSMHCGLAPDMFPDDPTRENPMRRDGPVAELHGTQVDGWFDVPYFLGDVGDAGRPPGEGSGLARSPTDNLPVLNESRTRRFRFIAYVPTTVEDALPGTVPVTIYAHGLLGSAASVLDHGDPTRITPEYATAQLAEEAGVVVVATDLIGLTDLDETAIVRALGDLSAFDTVTDRALQGIVATLVLGQVFGHGCGGEAPLNVIDPNTVFYDGDSLGGIIGPTIAALSPNIHRYVMGVGGISFPTMIPRSTDFLQLTSILSNSYRRPVDRQLLMVMFANHWDRFEGATFAPHVFEDRLVTGAIPQVLYQVAEHDRGTPEVGGEIAARTMDLPVLEASITHPTGLVRVDAGPPDGRGAYVAYAEGGEAPPEGPVLPCDTDPLVHELVRRDPRARAQAVEFLRSGAVIDTCDGGCTAPPAP